ncbi:TraR/DksA C4-type zinc finger protein [Rheinheimera sp.]|uniref:TraR/DksA C4-type zinc finger protein n=1 Tax=Rheinheimera marina TaxID=1774958 RepID=A0ABV9JJJ0_9GAMM
MLIQREQLQLLQQELQQRLHKLQQDFRQSHSKDGPDQAAERENDEVLQQLETQLAAELYAAEAALDRFDAGRYGLCSRCGQSIAAPRLQALPLTLYCQHCA